MSIVVKKEGVRVLETVVEMEFVCRTKKAAISLAGICLTSYLVLFCLVLPSSLPSSHLLSPPLPSPPTLLSSSLSSPSSPLPSPPTPLPSSPLPSAHLFSFDLASIPFPSSLLFSLFFSNFGKILKSSSTVHVLSIPDYSLLVITMVSRLFRTLYTCVLTNLSLNGG